MKEIKIVIIEDEAVTARNLVFMLQSIDAGISITAILESVQDAVAWLHEHPSGHDLIFSDIRLTDGLSFEIFKRTKVDTPVIFVTAYDDHAIEAFKNNGIDYILKPFDEQELRAALKKFTQLTAYGKVAAGSAVDISSLFELVQRSAKTYRNSFLISYRDKLIPVGSQKMAWFYTANDLVYANTCDDRRYIIEETLERLEEQLDPALFFRANRQFIVNRKAICEVEHYFNGRLLVLMDPPAPEKVLISKARATQFKNWMNH